MSKLWAEKKVNAVLILNIPLGVQEKNISPIKHVQETTQTEILTDHLKLSFKYVCYKRGPDFSWPLSSNEREEGD